MIAIADAIFEGDHHPDVRMIGQEDIDSEYDEADDEFDGDEVENDANKYGEDAVYVADVRTVDRGVVRIAVATLEGRWGMRLGVGSLIEQVPGRASVASVCSDWLVRWEAYASG